MPDPEQEASSQRWDKRLMQKGTSRREFIRLGAVGVGGGIVAAYAAYNRLTQDNGGLNERDLELEVRANKLEGLAQAQINEYVNKELLDKYQFSIEPIGKKALAEQLWDDTTPGYMFLVQANLISDFHGEGMLLLVDSTFDQNNNWLGTRIGVQSPLEGDTDVLPEFANLGMIKFRSDQDAYDYIPPEMFEEVAYTAFNLPPDVQWGDIYTYTHGRERFSAREGTYLAYGKPANVMITEQGTISHEIS